MKQHQPSHLSFPLPLLPILGLLFSANLAVPALSQTGSLLGNPLGGPTQPALPDRPNEPNATEPTDAPAEALPINTLDIKRLKVAGQEVEFKALGNLDVLAPMGDALTRLGVTVTRAAAANVPTTTTDPATAFQINLSGGGAPIVLSIGQRTAYIGKAEQPLRAAPLVFKDQIWLPVFSLAPLLGAATRLAPDGTLLFNPTIQSVELFPVKGVLALTVKASAPLPEAGKDGAPTVGTLENPSKIYIDFPGFALGLDAATSTSERVVATGLGSVERVRAGMFQKSPDTARVVLDLEEAVKTQPQSLPDKSLFALLLLDPNATFSTPPKNTLDVKLNGWIIVVDAGHGGHDSGARGKKSFEKNHTLDIALRLRDQLRERGANVLMTRDADFFVTLQGRVDFANSRKADLFVSCHIDAAPSATPTGTTTYHWTPQSLNFAREIHAELAKAVGFKDKGVRTERFFVVRHTWMPSVLTESCYITNPRDEQSLLDEKFRQRLAAGMAQGIANYAARYGKSK